MSQNLPKKVIRVGLAVTQDAADADVVDLDTGERVVFEGARYRWHVFVKPNAEDSHAYVVLELAKTPIVAEAALSVGEYYGADKESKLNPMPLVKEEEVVEPEPVPEVPAEPVAVPDMVSSVVDLGSVDEE